MQSLSIPELSLVVLIGASGSGKSTFARRLFAPTETLSSDACRAWVSNDENDQSATNDAFDLLYYIAGKRLKNGHLTVVDATNVRREDRKGLVELARRYHCLPVAIVLNLPEKVCEARNRQRADRSMGGHVIRQQSILLQKSIRHLKDEGFRHIHVLRSEEEVNALQQVVREKLYNDKKELTGPFDIIGDVHGCFSELKTLLGKLGYTIESDENPAAPQFGYRVTAPEGRTAVFLGDLVDRGPDSPGVLRLVMSMVNGGQALCVPGNHDIKLMRHLGGKQTKLTHGLDKTVAQLEAETATFKVEVAAFLDRLVSHYVLDGGRLVVAHAGLREDMQGRGSGAVRQFCMFGETTGETDEFGLPVRYNWAMDYRGKARVVYGHTPVPVPEWLNHTIDIDTGCVFGGSLTALRYPAMELVQVPAAEIYCEPVRPLHYGLDGQASAQQQSDDLLHMEDVQGKRLVQTTLRPNITINEENSIAALEVMSRFAVNPKWLVYLPPTMSPPATSSLPNLLEHPQEAFDYYRQQGVTELVCEEKHMGSRAIVVVCRSAEAARRRFGVESDEQGVCYTRTGRAFFTEKTVEAAFIGRVAAAIEKAGLWEELETEWMVLDTELMPWSAKAQSLIREQYAAVGAAASASLPVALEALTTAAANGVPVPAALMTDVAAQQVSVGRFQEAYRHYCWPVHSLDDYRLAPFHLLASEKAVHHRKPHRWHLEVLARLAPFDVLIQATTYKVVNLEEDASVQEAIDWWTALTAAGGEGMVVKPADFTVRGKNDWVQPAVKCRGSEYLRIIYGPHYDQPGHLSTLKSRGLSRKQSLAIREYALGIEALQRFVANEPLRRVHEAVFAVLALESEEVDPRL